MINVEKSQITNSECEKSLGIKIDHKLILSGCLVLVVLVFLVGFLCGGL